jgi:hypothetical protein
MYKSIDFYDGGYWIREQMLVATRYCGQIEMHDRIGAWNPS